MNRFSGSKISLRAYHRLTIVVVWYTKRNDRLRIGEIPFHVTKLKCNHFQWLMPVHWHFGYFLRSCRQCAQCSRSNGMHIGWCQRFHLITHRDYDHD